MQHHIPPEILSEIFLYSLSPIKEESRPDRTWFLQPQFLPILLTRVCRHWRAVAHSTPRLWSDLSRLPRVPQKTSLHDSFFASVQAWLTYGGTQPLIIRVSGDRRADVIARYISVLCTHSERWDDAAFIVHQGPDVFPQLLGSPFPVSRNLDSTRISTTCTMIDIVPCLCHSLVVCPQLPACTSSLSNIPFSPCSILHPRALQP